MIRKLYRRLLPDETRYWLYKLRNQHAFDELRTVVYPSPKGDFSLRGFDRLECIFVHVTKTAGTAVAKTLLGELPYHYTAWQYRVIYGRRTFDDYFKFAFVRNPWDRLHSAYAYLRGGGWNEDDRQWFSRNLSGIDDFNAFVLEWLEPERLRSHVHLWPQVDFLFDRRGECLLDCLGYFESLEEDFQRVCARLGVERELRHENPSNKPDYREVYSPDAIERVGHLYADDVRRFGYTFEGLARRKSVADGRLVDAGS